MTRRQLALLTVLALGTAALAERVQLLDGTEMNAKLVHYYDGMFTLEVDGKVLKVPQAKIKSMTFELPAPRIEFSSPRKTFQYWRSAMAARDFGAMVECYALVYQGMATRQYESLQPKDREAMWEQAAAMKIEWESVDVKGDRAVATIRALRGKEKAEGQLSFSRENGEWKMTPGPMGFGPGPAK